jgi:actin-related protein
MATEWLPKPVLSIGITGGKLASRCLIFLFRKKHKIKRQKWFTHKNKMDRSSSRRRKKKEQIEKIFKDTEKQQTDDTKDLERKELMLMDMTNFQK